MFRRAVPVMMRATRPVFGARTLPNGFEDVTSPVDIATGATVDLPTELLLTLTRQDEFIFAAEAVKGVTLSTGNGKMGILPGHEYVIEKLAPGVIEVETMDGKTNKYATAGGFAHVNTDGSVDVNCAECIPFDSIDLALVEKELAAAQDLSKNGPDDAAKIRGSIGVEVLEPLAEALKSA
eukprot:TRINITY_DN28779_c0_g1_i1.p1 TRINITY_DN28779_c0_g1~~TRINITY_DN28779_c0_g1_i1.p1  ORF type:complete len:180 (+),score=70.39 TRINITY_DN28779_c0_g1_i1:69-608(+)